MNENTTTLYPLTWRVTWEFPTAHARIGTKRAKAMQRDFPTQAAADCHKANLKASYGAAIVICTTPIFISNTPR